MSVDPPAENATPRSPKAIWKRWYFWVGAIVVVVVVAAIAGGAGNRAEESAGSTSTPSETTAAGSGTTTTTMAASTTTPATATTSTATTSTVAGTSTTSPTTTVPQPTTTTEARPEPVFGEGLWLVGEEIGPGLYQTLGGVDSCYWERLSGLSGELDDIIANGIATGQEIVEIDPSDVAFNSERCGEWYEIIAPAQPANAFQEGAVVVGVHIEPGTYAAPGGESCYWARLSGFGGIMDEIIANDLPSERAIVEISASDAGFRSNGCGGWEKTG